MSNKDELAALKARVAELEAQAKPPEPFVPEPYQRWDPTAGMSMPRSAMQAMVNAVPDHLMRDVVKDHQGARTGRPDVIPGSQQSSVRPGGGFVSGSGTGWSREIPLGPSHHQRYVDAQLDAQNAKDRRELIEPKARERAFLKAAKGKS